MNIINSKCIHTLIAISLFIFLSPLFLIPSYSSLEPVLESDLSVVKPKDSVDFTVIIKNVDFTEATINDIIAISPSWITKTEIDLDKTTLKKGDIFYDSFSVTIPDNIEAGKHKLILVLDSDQGQYSFNKEIEVQRFTTITLTGNVPVSIFIVLITGVATYMLIAYLVTQKFDRSLPEILLVGFTFGILIWFGTGKTLEDVTSSTIWHYLLIAAISIGLAFLFSFFIMFLHNERVKDSLEKQIRNFRKQFLSQGYAASLKPAWLYYVLDQVKDVKRKGKDYSLTVKITLKDQFNTIHVGSLWITDEQRPYDVVLHPKYNISCTKAQFISALTYEEKDSKKIKDNSLQYYLKKSSNKKDCRKKLFGENDKREITMEIIRTTLSNMELNELENKLKKLDVSQFSHCVATQLEKEAFENIRISREYTLPVFIPADNILDVEILSYEPRFQFTMGDLVYPKTYKHERTIIHEEHF